MGPAAPPPWQGRTLFLVADAPTLGPTSVVDLVTRALGGVDGRCVAVVDRDAGPAAGGSSDRVRLARLHVLRELCEAHEAALIVTGRADLAAASGAAGVQLPEAGLPAPLIRRAFPGLAIGRSCHDRDGLEAAAAAGASWAWLAPVLAPISKRAGGGPPLGIEGFAALASGMPMPIYGLGGITAAIARPLRDAGAAGVATIGHVFLAADPGAAAAALL